MENKIKSIEKLYFKDFSHFFDKKHPHYEMYQDRKEELAHDRGYNNGVEDVCRLLSINANKPKEKIEQ